MPAQPHHRPSEPTIGWARTWSVRTCAVGPDDAVLHVERPAGLRPTPPCRRAPRRDRRRGPCRGGRRACRRSRADRRAWMRWNSSLHCMEPVRRSHSQLPTFASASLSRTRASISARLACASRCSVMSRPTTSAATGSPLPVEHRAQRQRDRHRHAVGPLDLRLEVADRVARHHRCRSAAATSPAHVDRRRARCTRRPRIPSAGWPKSRSAARFELRDAPGDVEAQDGVVGRLQDRVEEPEGGGQRGR